MSYSSSCTTHLSPCLSNLHAEDEEVSKLNLHAKGKTPDELCPTKQPTFTLLYKIYMLKMKRSLS